MNSRRHYARCGLLLALGTLLPGCPADDIERICLDVDSETDTIVIRDYEFERYMFFDLGFIGGEEVLQPGDTILEFELFQEEIPENTEAPPVRAYENWFDTTMGDQPVDSRFRRLIWLEEYNLHEIDHYLWFLHDLENVETSTLAYYMVFKRPNGQSIDTVGQLSWHLFDAPHRLQILKRAQPAANDPFKAAEWKNVYSLRRDNIDYDAMKLDIFKGELGDEANPMNEPTQRGVPYIELLGLDSLNISGNPCCPDRRIDYKASILDLEQGLLVFPTRKPFALDVLDEPVPGIYSSEAQNDQRESSKYYLRFLPTFLKSNLRVQNIVPNSEVVTFNGRRLNRGTDYVIEYETGIFEVLKATYFDPNANLNICYDAKK